jgi:hypothetical protein
MTPLVRSLNELAFSKNLALRKMSRMKEDEG